MKPYHRRCFSASASKIKDVLIVKKASRFDRLAGLSRVHDAAINEKSARKAGVMMTAKLRNIRDNHRDQLEDAKKEHNKIVEELEKKLNDAGPFKATVVNAEELTDEHVKDKDLCMSVGGTNTFFKLAAHIKDSSRTAILGIEAPI